MHDNIQKILITEEEIRQKVRELGQQITRDYQGKDVVFVGVLKGVVMFYSDIVRQIDLPCEFDFMWISSYVGTESTGKMQVRRDVSTDLRGRHVVILEDIFDTGNSLEFTYRHLLTKEPASLRVCTFLDKPEHRRAGVTVKADYTGFTIPNEFVVGYGMEIMLKIFSICNGVVLQIAGRMSGISQAMVHLPGEIQTAIEEVGFLASIPLWLVTILGSLFILVLSFIMILTVYGRFFRLYMYTALAPLPLSTFAGECTQSVGISFLKSYVGVCLEGAVIVLACIIYAGFVNTPSVGGGEATTMVWSYLAETVFNMLVLVGLIKGSDRIIHEMMGL